MIPCYIRYSMGMKSNGRPGAALASLPSLTLPFRPLYRSFIWLLARALLTLVKIRARFSRTQIRKEKNIHFSTVKLLKKFVINNLRIWFGTWKVRHLAGRTAKPFQIDSRRSELIQTRKPFMYLIQCIRFGTWHRIACVANVSVWFRSKERPRNEILGFGRARNETRAIKCAILRALFDSGSSFFAPKPHLNACYAG